MERAPLHNVIAAGLGFMPKYTAIIESIQKKHGDELCAFNLPSL
jgi:hypothetical protein